MRAIPIAFVDANAIYGRVPRSLLMHAHLHDLCRLHWTEQVLNEAFSRLLRNRPDLDPQALVFTRAQMQRAIPDGLIPDPQALRGLNLSDPDDVYVVSGAVAAGADIIVSANTRHFPRPILEPLGLQVQSPDDFLAARLATDDLSRRLIGGAVAGELGMSTTGLPAVLRRNALDRTAALFE